MRALALDVNLLVNTNFSANSGQNIATGWTFFEDPTIPSTTKDHWIGVDPPTGGVCRDNAFGHAILEGVGPGLFSHREQRGGDFQTLWAAAGLKKIRRADGSGDFLDQ